MYEALRYTGQSKCGGCARKVHVLIRGDLHGTRPGVVMGAGLRPGVKAPDWPPDPNAASAAARSEATGCVNVQKSAEGIVGDRTWNGLTPRARTR